MRKLLGFGVILLTLMLCGVGASAQAAVALPAIGGLHSPSHPDPARWYPNRHVTFAWTPLVGVAGYSYSFDRSPATSPDATLDLAALSFASTTEYTTGITPYSVTVADFNGDGKPDLAVANSDVAGGNTVSVLLGDGAGGFGAKTDYATGVSPYSVTVADFNGDGKPDLAVANSDENTVSVLLGDGAGGFAAKTNYATGDRPMSVAVGDFNGDGTPDLVTADQVSNTVSVLLGNATGGFAVKTDYTTALDPMAVALSDFNRDGKPDLVTTNSGDNTVSVLLGDGTGGFGTKTDYPTGAYPNSVAVGDFNDDGTQDLAVANWHDSSISVLLGDGTGGFGTKTDYTTGAYPVAVAAGDFNGDGIPDLATADRVGPASVLLGDGRGGFAATRDFPSDADPFAIAVGDFNRDGKPDLVATDYGADAVSVFLNTTPRVAFARTATADGLWYFHASAADGLGGLGPTATCTVRIDTRSPTTRAYRSSVHPGRIAHLHCAVSDPQPCAGWAKVQIDVRDADGKLVRRVIRDRQRLGRFTAGFRCALAPGTYRFRVYATDAAGNRQCKVGTSLLIVP